MIDPLCHVAGERIGWKLDDFVAHDRARSAGLMREEVLGLRLYTGPMYAWYNNRVLRKEKDAERKGQYVTTIHCIASAIVTLSKKTKPAHG